MPHTSRKTPDIVFVTIDSLRADHLGCYGYSKPTSPAIDALAAESLVFEQAIAAGIPTMPSFTTLLTGLHPYRHGIVAHSGNRRLSDRIVLLPQLLQQQGYVTVGVDNLVIQGGGRGSWFARGYDHYCGYIYKPFGDQSTWITDRALEFLDLYGGSGERDPLFLFLHYWDPHTPYGPRPPYDTMHYEPGSGPVDMAEVKRIHPDYYDVFLDDMRLAHPDDYAYVVAQYDGEISQVDAQVGRLVDGIKARESWDDTVFVVMSDHGECFGEGDFYFDHHGLYDAVTRVALMMHGPGITAGRTTTLVSTEDIMPTVLDLVGAAEPPDPLTGTSLAPLLRGARRHVRPHVVSVESSRQASLALRTPEWKLILPVVSDAAGNPLPDFYGRPRSSTPLLFDLRADPGERHSLHIERPDKLEELSAMLGHWRTAMANATGEPDPIASQGLSLSYDRFMRRLFGRR